MKETSKIKCCTAVYYSFRLYFMYIKLLKCQDLIEVSRASANTQKWQRCSCMYSLFNPGHGSCLSMGIGFYLP